MNVRLRLLASALSALMLAFAFAPTSIFAAASPEFLNQVIVLTNEQRRAAGCGNLTWDAQLATAAQQHADDMAANNYFSHNSRNGARFTTRIRSAGYSYRLAAENLAAGQTTPEEVVAGWMSSPAHRANILNCRLTNIGIGYGFNGASEFGSYWVQDMATRR